MAIILKLQVWIGVLLATVVITLLLYMAEATYRYIPSRDAGNDESMRAIPSYVLGVILNQGNVIFKCHLQHVKLTKCNQPGGYCASKRNAIRLLATCWCLASVAFIYSYNSVLIAYLTLSDPYILINSIEELKDRPDVHLVTDRGLSTEARLLVRFEFLHSKIEL